jgi:zinc protease
VVGAFEPAKLRPLVERYLASLPATKAKREQIADVKLRVKKGTVAHVVKAGSEDKSMTFLVSASTVKWSLALDADAQILRNVLDMQLLELLREKLGGTYTVRVQAEVDRNPPQGSLLIVLFESAPGNAKQMQEEAWKGLDKLATTPVTDDTLAKVREQLKKAHDTAVTENEFWQRALIRHARYGDDLDQIVSIDLVVARATKDQIQKTARALVDKSNRATLTLLPEK